MPCPDPMRRESPYLTTAPNGSARIRVQSTFSDDSGRSWQAKSAPVTNSTSVVCSADGSHLAAVQGSGQVFTSSDRGLAWQVTIPGSRTNVFDLVVCSADGNKVVAIGDLVCVSTNAAPIGLKSVLRRRPDRRNMPALGISSWFRLRPTPAAWRASGATTSFGRPRTRERSGLFIRRSWFGQEVFLA